MAHLFEANLVRLLCSCGTLKPIPAIYFCRHCLKLRCANCVSHEVDMLYCPNCLENMPSTEARLKKNRCGNCFDCPSCGESLSTRASTIQSTDPEQPSRSVQRKLYYLACTSCRWTSRDVNIQDQTVATGGWAEQEAPNQERILALLEHYRAVAQRDKLERDRKDMLQASAKNTPMYLRTGDVIAADKFSSMSPSLASMRKSFAQMSTYAYKAPYPLGSEISPSEAVEEVEGLPADIFTEPVVLTQVCSMKQRLSTPEHQPSLTTDLYPLHKHMLVKESIRCRHCEHNLSKPEYNPSSIKFKIHLLAYYHVPEVRLVSPVCLRVGVETRVQVSLCNPTAHLMPVALLPFLPAQHFQALLAQDSSKDGGSITSSCVGPSSVTSHSGTTIGSLTRLIEVPCERHLPVLLCQVVRLPQGQVVLAARDDTAEYGDTMDQNKQFRDDPQVVAWRRANKVGVDLLVTPDAADLGQDLYLGFMLRYDYTNTVIATNTTGSSSGPLSLGPNALSGPPSIGSGYSSGPNSISGATSLGSMGPTAEFRTITLNVPVVIKVGKVEHDPSESHA